MKLSVIYNTYLISRKNIILISLIYLLIKNRNFSQKANFLSPCAFETR